MSYRYTWHTIPRDPEQNAIWRATTAAYTGSGNPNDEVLKQRIMERCARDFWFWAYGFAYCHEPRTIGETKVPWLAWPHQIPIVDHILQVVGKKDVRLVKSRAQGATWIMVFLAVWLWLFHRGSVINFVSKDLDAGDKPGDMNSVGAKVDWLLSTLPEWMVGKKRRDWDRNKGEHTFSRADGETVMAFFACTANVATGGRALIFFMDEHAKHPRPQDKDAMASTQPVTNCRVCLSTPFGMGGEFARIVHDDTIDEPLLKLCWWDNLTQNRGLYKIQKGRPVAVDEAKYGPVPGQYLVHEKWARLKERLLERGYDLTADQFRSPWYDEECLRQGANPVLIAQEYDMNFGAEGANYFSEVLVNRLKGNAQRPKYVGELFVHQESLTGTWSENEDGRLRLWCELDIMHNPPIGDYVVACDVAAGIGGSESSNSAIAVFNRRTGRKVASFTTPAVLPYNLAEIAIALCRWFVNHKGVPAFLIWEANGYGKEFGLRVEQTDFHHYFRRQTKDAPLHSSDTKYAGYWTTKRSYLLGPYREALLEGYFDDPDKESIEELRQYQMGSDGEPYHVGENDKSDPSGAKSAHGDRVVANALAHWASIRFGDQMKSRLPSKGVNVMNVRTSDVERTSFAWRRAQHLEERIGKKNQPNTW